MDEYLSKPLKQNTLIQVILKVASRPRSIVSSRLLGAVSDSLGTGGALMGLHPSIIANEEPNPRLYSLGVGGPASIKQALAQQAAGPSLSSSSAASAAAGPSSAAEPSSDGGVSSRSSTSTAPTDTGLVNGNGKAPEMTADVAIAQANVIQAVAQAKKIVEAVEQEAAKAPEGGDDRLILESGSESEEGYTTVVVASGGESKS